LPDHRRDVLIDELERHLGSFFQKGLEFLRIGDARHLYENAVVALALNRWFFHTRFVDAAANHLDRLLDRPALTRLDDILRQRHRDVAGSIDIECHLAIDIAQRVAETVRIARIRQLDDDLAVVDTDTCVADLGLLQDVPH